MSKATAMQPTKRENEIFRVETPIRNYERDPKPGPHNLPRYEPVQQLHLQEKSACGYRIEAHPARHQIPSIHVGRTASMRGNANKNSANRDDGFRCTTYVQCPLLRH